MVETITISKTKVSESKLKTIDFSNLPFGKEFTDHMFLADYRHGEWKNFRIIPYGNIPMSPASPTVHYGQSIFEGIKAYASATANEALVFRPLDNWKRMNISAERMCMPAIPEELFMDGMAALIDLDRAWIPKEEGSSLYIRPFMFSADEYIGIRPSQDFTFMIILSPTGPYYSTPVKVKIETYYTRAVQGGTGYAKAGGNYGGAIYPAKLAQDQGYHQLIWTDGKNHEYVEESGTMNVMFVMDDVLITPALSDSILAGVTRQSVLELARHWNVPVEERRVSVEELVKALEDGRVQEAFGVGTAATIAQIELIGFEGKDYRLQDVKQRKFSNKVYDELEKIKRGKATDLFDWVHRI